MGRKLFDVLVVYSDRIATSAGVLRMGVSSPFARNSSREGYNLVYGYFLKTCRENNLKVAFTTTTDITGPGECRNYWLYKNGSWLSVKSIAYSKIIFDKLAPTTKRIKGIRDLLFSSKKVKPFNPPYLFSLFFDKQKTYEKLFRFSIPTVSVEGNTIMSVNTACWALGKIVAEHPQREDFSDEIIMKDRFGAGGLNVYKFNINEISQMARSLKRHSRKSFIIQPFIEFDKGFCHQDTLVSADIRLIYLRNRIVQTYIRMAKVGDFCCNEHRGGTLKYISKDQVPRNVLLAAGKIVKVLNKRFSLYALDFIVSNNGNPYFLEGNTGPGLDWNLSSQENEIEAQKLIKIVIKELVKRVGRDRIAAGNQGVLSP